MSLALVGSPHLIVAVAQEHPDLAAGPGAAVDSIQTFVKRTKLSSLPVILLLHKNLGASIGQWRDYSRGRGLYARELQIRNFVPSGTLMSLRPHVADLLSTALHEVSDAQSTRLIAKHWYAIVGAPA